LGVGAEAGHGRLVDGAFHRPTRDGLRACVEREDQQGEGGGARPLREPKPVTHPSHSPNREERETRRPQPADHDIGAQHEQCGDERGDQNDGEQIPPVPLGAPGEGDEEALWSGGLQLSLWFDAGGGGGGTTTP
jgi:hypothetical protein